jgi:hypothetical protein
MNNYLWHTTLHVQFPSKPPKTFPPNPRKKEGWEANQANLSGDLLLLELTKPPPPSSHQAPPWNHPLLWFLLVGGAAGERWLADMAGRSGRLPREGGRRGLWGNKINLEEGDCCWLLFSQMASAVRGAQTFSFNSSQETQKCCRDKSRTFLADGIFSKSNQRLSWWPLFHVQFMDFISISF